MNLRRYVAILHCLLVILSALWIWHIELDQSLSFGDHIVDIHELLFLNVEANKQFVEQLFLCKGWRHRMLKQWLNI
jgi:hypothetical protein